MTTATFCDEKTRTFLLAEKPRGFSQLHRQNQLAIIQLINEVLLEFQEKKWTGGVELEIASGSVITQIKPKPTLKVQIAE